MTPSADAGGEPEDRIGYRLLDFGGGRKLESFAGYILDRPSPAAEGCERRRGELWPDADARFDAAGKAWVFHRPWPEDLSVDTGFFRMPIRPTPFGHVGLFPEQRGQWKWLARGLDPQVPEAVPAALNLFAYTGASTLALALAGFRVAHVDAAKPNVQAAGIAADLNDGARERIRFIIDDATTFAARELRRERRYHTIVLDPPAYGHSPRGKAWRLERDVWRLLDTCLRLVNPNSFRLLVTGHSPQVGPADIVDFVAERWGQLRAAESSSPGLRSETGRSQLVDLAGRSLDAGFFARFESRVPGID